jgi:hypothetical protein
MKIIPIETFCLWENKTPRQVRRLYRIHAGLKVQVKGEKTSRVNYSLWLKILANPRGYVKLKRK